MAGVDTDIPNWKERLVAELKGSKKKIAVLAGLVIVGAIVGGRLIFKSPPVSKAGAAVGGAGPSAVLDEPGHMASLRDPVVPWAARKDNEGGETGIRVRSKITRDIFAPHLDSFPPDQDEPARTKVSVVAPTVDPNVLRVQAIRAQARVLVLQSTIISSRPTVIINGQVLGVGDWINEFEIVEITARMCVVAKKGIRVQLEMSE